jgi:hypothetical protein
MTLISVKFTTHEIELLSSLASDQLFRREFIDSRLPGFHSNPADLNLGKKLVERLRVTADRVKRVPAPKRNGAHAV